MKYKLVMDIEINSVEDLKKLRTIVEANNLDKLNYSEIARNLGIDRRTAKKYYLGDDKKERKKKKSVIDEHYNIIEELLSEDSTINCKYRIVFVPKYRRQIIYGKIKQDVGRILRQLCEYKGVELIEAEACKDHIHMLVSISPKLRVSSFMGYLKSKSSLMIFDRHANLKYKYGNRRFWCRGYYVSAVGKNKKAIENYIRTQL